MSDTSERMLYVVTARVSLAWSSFKRIFGEFDLENTAVGGGDHSTSRVRRIQTVRALDCLGHCDFEFGASDSRVYITPAVFVRLPKSGLPSFVLAGGRSPETRKKLELLCGQYGCRLTACEQDSELPLIPERLVMEGETVESVKALSKSLGVHCEVQPVSWLMANFTASLDEYLEAARWQSDGELNWPRDEFHSEVLAFRTTRRGSNVLVRYKDPKRGRFLHLFRKDDRNIVVDCDWGRFAALREAGLNVLTYDERKQLFVSPLSTPLPRLLARTLALCSGYSPSFLPKSDAGWRSPECKGFDVFRGVPLAIAQLVSEKLGQSLVPRPIKSVP